MQVKRNYMLSNQCNIYNGVKQDGCLSVTLFSIDLNNVIDVLRYSNIGCRYGYHYYGCVLLRRLHTSCISNFVLIKGNVEIM